MVSSSSLLRIGIFALLAAALWTSCAPKYEDCVFACGANDACPTDLHCSSGFCTRQAVCRSRTHDSGVGGQTDAMQGGTGAALPATGGEGQGGTGGANPAQPDAPTDASGGEVGAGGMHTQTDGPDGEGGTTCDPTAPFDVYGQAVRFLDDRPLWLSAITLREDGLEAYLAGKTDSQLPFRLFRASRGSLSEDFGSVSPLLDSRSGPVIGADPALSPDGLSLYYTYVVEGDIYRTTRDSIEDGFGVGIPLEGVNLVDRTEGDPFVSRDDKTLYFDTNRDGDYEMYYASIDTLGVDDPIRVTVSERFIDDKSPVVSKDNLTIYFASKREGERFFDIWVATRKFVSDGFGQPFRPANINTDSHDYPEALSDDGCTLWYSSGDDLTLLARKTPR